MQTIFVEYAIPDEFEDNDSALIGVTMMAKAKATSAGKVEDQYILRLLSGP